MRKRRLVHVIESASGGSFRYVQEICHLLDPDEWEIALIHSRRPDSPTDMRPLFPSHVRLIEVPMQRDISLRADLKALWCLRKLIRSLQPDLLHLHSSKAGALGRVAALGCKTNVLYTPHGFAFFRQDISERKRKLFWWLERLLAWLPCHLLVGSQPEYHAAIAWVGQERSVFLPNAVEVKDTAPNHQRTKGRLFLTVGRITAAKQPMRVAQIVRHVQERLPDAEFLWVGDGEGRQELEQAARDMGASIQVTGWVSPQEVQRLLAMSRAYVQASLWEGLPLALLEAMAMGKAVVASDIPAHRAVITPGRDGMLATTVKEYADILCEWLENPERAEEIGYRAWQTVRTHYSIERFGSSLQQVYARFAEKG
jgi:glycosyltransferase involved in cell wall biosynthesis